MFAALISHPFLRAFAHRRPGNSGCPEDTSLCAQVLFLDAESSSQRFSAKPEAGEKNFMRKFGMLFASRFLPGHLSGDWVLCSETSACKIQSAFLVLFLETIVWWLRVNNVQADGRGFKSFAAT